MKPVVKGLGAAFALAGAASAWAGGGGLVAFQGFSSDPATLNRGLEAPAVAFHPLHGGVHGEAKFCMARYDNGYTSFIVFFSQHALGLTQAGVAVSVLAPDGRRWFSRHLAGRKEFSASTTGCDVRVGRDRVWGDPATFQIQFDRDDIAADLRYTDLVPPWQPGDGNVWFKGPDERPRYYLAVQAPWARVQGTIRLDGNSMKADGYGYCDQSFATILSSDQASLWASFRGFPFPSTVPDRDPRVEFLEFTTTPQYGAQRVPWLLVLRQGRILAATERYTLRAGSMIHDPVAGYDYPAEETFEGVGDDFQVRGRLKTLRMIELADVFRDTPSFLRVLAEAFLKRPVFYRLLSRYEIDLTLAGTRYHLTGDAVSEWGIVR